MVITILEAEVEEARSAVLVELFKAAGTTLPSAIVESFLLRDESTGTWRILTVWVDRDALRSYRDSVETPEGVIMFRSADAEPTLTILDVEAHLRA